MQRLLNKFFKIIRKYRWLSSTALLVLFFATIVCSFYFFYNNQKRIIKFTIDIVEIDDTDAPFFDTTNQRVFAIKLSNLDDVPISTKTILTQVYVDDLYLRSIVWPSRRGVVSMSYKGPRTTVFYGETVYVSIDKKDLQPGKHTLTIESSLYNYAFIFMGRPLAKNSTQYHFKTGPCPTTAPSPKSDAIESETTGESQESHDEIGTKREHVVPGTDTSFPP